MIHQTDPLTLVAALGALEVQIATRLLHEPLPVTQTHLCNVLHKTDKTVAKALYNLDIYNICTHSPEGWRITPDGICKLFKPGQVLEVPQEEAETESLVDTCPVDTCPVDNPVEKGWKFSTSNPLTTTSNSSIKLINKKLKKNLVLVVKPELDAYAKPEPEPEQDPEPEPEAKTETEQKPKSLKKIQECYKTALAAGIIWEQTAQELAEMPHVTPELINYHIGKVLAEKKEIPLAIYRIKVDKSLKNPSWGKPYPNQRSQGYDDRQRYVNGINAEWISH